MAQRDPGGSTRHAASSRATPDVVGHEALSGQHAPATATDVQQRAAAQNCSHGRPVGGRRAWGARAPGSQDCMGRPSFVPTSFVPSARPFSTYQAKHCGAAWQPASVTSRQRSRLGLALRPSLAPPLPSLLVRSVHGRPCIMARKVSSVFFIVVHAPEPSPEPCQPMLQQRIEVVWQCGRRRPSKLRVNSDMTLLKPSLDASLVQRTRRRSRRVVGATGAGRRVSSAGTCRCCAAHRAGSEARHCRRG